jgi:hypothetical protein
VHSFVALQCSDQQSLQPADFVRKEYALALKLKKNIVPVAHEEFDWPDASRLPKDCAGVMSMNAVKCVGGVARCDVSARCSLFCYF